MRSDQAPFAMAKLRDPPEGFYTNASQPTMSSNWKLIENQSLPAFVDHARELLCADKKTWKEHFFVEVTGVWQTHCLPLKIYQIHGPRGSRSLWWRKYLKLPAVSRPWSLRQQLSWWWQAGYFHGIYCSTHYFLQWWGKGTVVPCAPRSRKQHTRRSTQRDLENSSVTCEW